MKSIGETANEISQLQDARLARNDWKAELVTNRNGEPQGNELNVITALEKAPELQGLIAYNEFADEVCLMAPAPWRKVNKPELWTDIDRIELQA